VLAFGAAVGVAVAASLWSLAVPRRLRPEASARLLMWLAIVASLGALWAVVLVAGANIVQLHGVAERLALCQPVLMVHRGSLGIAGYVAIALLLTAMYSATRVWRRHRRLRSRRDAPTLAVVPVDEPMAYTVPGNPGQIILTTGLLRRLDLDERRVVVAHERAHLDFRHYRFVRAAQLSAAVFPLAAPLERRVRLATERWADEVAARDLGDRELVARTVVHAAELRVAAGAELGIAAAGTVERVRALLLPAPRRSPVVEGCLVLGVVLIAAALVASLFDVHGWIAALFGICA
jgi:Zn-dependent protease with chaperone function